MNFDIEHPNAGAARKTQEWSVSHLIFISILKLWLLFYEYVCVCGNNTICHILYSIYLNMFQICCKHVNDFESSFYFFVDQFVVSSVSLRNPFYKSCRTLFLFLFYLFIFFARISSTSSFKNIFKMFPKSSTESQNSSANSLSILIFNLQKCLSFIS